MLGKDGLACGAFGRHKIDVAIYRNNIYDFTKNGPKTALKV
jgi:hypothetical protein